MVISGAFIAGYLVARYFGDSVKNIIEAAWKEIVEWV